MTYERDPLSVRYDASAGRLIGAAIRRPGQWVVGVVPRPDTRRPAAVRWLARLGIRLDVVDAGGLTRYERAYQRSLYWTGKRMGISVTAQDNPRWCMQRRWGDTTPRGRLLAVRLSDPAVARRAVARKPKRDQWWRNPELRSGAIDSGQSRFG